jgi:type I restriction enzyme S subunit
MNTDRLLALYDHVGDAPDAIPRLRRFVLDLAVRGKLEEQDAADEPASELLKRIAAGKSRLVKAGKIRKIEDFAPLGPGEDPFPLPKGWVWSRIGEVSSKTGSGSTPRGGKEVYKDAGVPFLRSQNVYDDGLRLDDVAYIDRDTHDRMSGTKVLGGDLLLNITGGSIGRCCRVPDDFEEANVSQHVAIIRPAVSGCTDFLHRVILSPYFQAFIFNQQTGAGRGGLPKNRMDRIAVALPPLAEQRRILAKVDELMALCDRLEASRGTREATRDRLTAASFARLTTPGTNGRTFRACARSVLNALPALTNRPDQVKALRQAILDLAVRGKLVEQDPTDEPVSELVKRTVAEKAKTTKTKKEKSRVPTADPLAGGLFDVPMAWDWVPLGAISDVTMGQSPPGETYNKSGHGVPLINGPVEFTAGPFGHTVINQFTTAPTNFCEEGDLLICVRGSTTGRTNVAAFRACIGRGVAAIRSPFDDAFVRLFLWQAREDIISMGRGIAFPSVSKQQLENLAIPLPPLVEQQRIVAKVDELMALCDRLEGALREAGATRRDLLAALLHQALYDEALTPAADLLEVAG